MKARNLWLTLPWRPVRAGVVAGRCIGTHLCSDGTCRSSCSRESEEHHPEELSQERISKLDRAEL